MEEFNEIWCCGGAAPFIINQLKNQFPNLRVHDVKNQIGLMWKAFGYDRENYPSELIEENLAERLIDVWGYFMVISNYLKTMEVSA